MCVLEPQQCLFGTSRTFVNLEVPQSGWGGGGAPRSIWALKGEGDEQKKKKHSDRCALRCTPGTPRPHTLIRHYHKIDGDASGLRLRTLFQFYILWAYRRAIQRTSHRISTISLESPHSLLSSLPVPLLAGNLRSCCRLRQVPSKGKPFSAK